MSDLLWPVLVSSCQLYDTGACVYFYFGFIFKGVADPTKTFSEVEHEARAEVLKQGGSLSHHHGTRMNFLDRIRLVGL